MKKSKKAIFLILPMMVLMGLLVYLPIIRTFFYSLHAFKLSRPDRFKFIGLDNYKEVLLSKDFHHAFENSFTVFILVVVLTIVSSIIVGLMLNKRTAMSPVLTGIAIIPWALPPLVNGIVWQFIFHPSYGFMNKLLMSLSIIDQPIAWINNRFLLLMVVSMVIAWRVVPFCAILILATLQTIPKEIYEAAKMDGANRFTEFFYITLRMIFPTLSIVLIQATMAGLNVFDEVISLVGYRYEGQTLLIYNYLNTFSFLDFGLGSAITYIIMIFSGIIGYFYIRSLRLEGGYA
ncbi:carbohydrate ABC transporter permease [Facklamia miroungae]|uniref:Multiple sugar transport system permease protein n=1 Tax=Facklamia miroungae TaxID=120956 RepID=A0A1G7UZ55_9LACT|nr:sugar ABC transporter permease [Facklamia miroungae]NKZ30207.1 sugar ABC transporter permease [Facklamia miroungae]SDG52813.1 multiple sugar transport system permease protein [Facklamia miroungae]